MEKSLQCRTFFFVCSCKLSSNRAQGTPTTCLLNRCRPSCAATCIPAVAIECEITNDPVTKRSLLSDIGSAEEGDRDFTRWPRGQREGFGECKSSSEFRSRNPSTRHQGRRCGDEWVMMVNIWSFGLAFESGRFAIFGCHFGGHGGPKYHVASGMYKKCISLL